MKYLCLVYLEDDKLHAVRDSECLAASERLRAEGRVVAAEALHPVHTATTLRVRDGALTMTGLPRASMRRGSNGGSCELGACATAFFLALAPSPASGALGGRGAKKIESNSQFS